MKAEGGAKMDVYRVTGTFKMGGSMQPFTKEFAGANKGAVKEQVYSILGSMHGVSRRFIVIDSVKKIPAEEATDLVAAYKAK